MPDFLWGVLIVAVPAGIMTLLNDQVFIVNFMVAFFCIMFLVAIVGGIFGGDGKE